MPGVVQHTLDTVRKAAVEAASAGLAGVMLFGIPETKDAQGSGALDPDGVLTAAITAVRQEVGDDCLVMSDVCLDEFTDHGHCGVLTPSGAGGQRRHRGDLRRDGGAARERRRAPGRPERHDGRPGRGHPGGAGRGRRTRTWRSWPTRRKYASAFYGPFREAVASTLTGDRKTYQQDPANVREALREVALDVAEGADIVMVKPALAYLDVIRAVRAAVDLPVAAYNVSGEYAMVEAAAAQGWINREPAIRETLTTHPAGRRRRDLELLGAGVCPRQAQAQSSRLRMRPELVEGHS